MINDSEIILNIFKNQIYLIFSWLKVNGVALRFDKLSDKTQESPENIKQFRNYVSCSVTALHHLPPLKLPHIFI